ncbi:MAG: glycine oxidase ThiO [bacterium]|nr:glycine oxidase ThiO [bacterium]
MSEPGPDVIVIGGGVIGLSIAWQLARGGLRVWVFERGVCGQEASWAAAGVLSPGNPNHRGLMSAMHLDSLSMYPEFVERIEEDTGAELEYERCGRVELCHTDQRYRMGLSEVRATAELQTPDGQSVLEMLTLEEAKQHEPGIDCDAFGALLCRVSARLRNTRLLKALRQACEHVGVRIHEERPINELLVEGERVLGVVAGDGRVHAGKTVLAAGAWSSQLHPFLEQVAPTFPSQGEAVLLHMDKPPVRGIIKRKNCYLVARPDGHVYLGATDDPEAGFKKRPSAAGTSQLMSTALELVPGLAEASVVNMWAGLRPRTDDRRPMIGPVPGLDGLIAAYGHYKTGLVFAPITARIVSELIVDGLTDYDLSRCIPGRHMPRRL